jgi:hypothetical protein
MPATTARASVKQQTSEMGEQTLKVPREQIARFRRCVYGELASDGDTLEKFAGALAFPGGRSWRELIGDDSGDEEDDNAERLAVDVNKASCRIAALTEVMEQLGWTDPIEGDVEVVADPELLKSLINDSLTDVGDTIDDITNRRPFDRRAFEAEIQRGIWLADQRDELPKAELMAEGIEVRADR